MNSFVLTIRKLLFLFICLIVLVSLTGCWESKKDLIKNKDTVTPFGDARFILWHGKTDILLEKKSEKYEIYNPDPNVVLKVIKFYEIETISSYFGKAKYIVGFHDKNLGYAYLYVEKSSDKWSLYGSSKKYGVTKMNNINGLVKTINKAKNNKKLRLIQTIKLKKINSTRAALHKQIQRTEYENGLRKEQQKKERARAELAKKQAEKAARDRARIANSDIEPTQYEMTQAVRRSTLAGALLNASVKKLGRCRKAAKNDYYCRYQYIDVNWGNFWKQNRTWHFKISN